MIEQGSGVIEQVADLIESVASPPVQPQLTRFSKNYPQAWQT